MNSLSNYIELNLSGIKSTDALYEYKSNILSKMHERANELQSRGLSDTNVINDLILEEYPDLKSDFFAMQKNLSNKNKTRSTLFSALSLGILYILSLTVLFLSYSFITNNWAKSWLIMVGGVFLLILTIFFIAAKRAAKKRMYKTARSFTAAFISILTVFSFLYSQIILEINKSYLIFIVAVALAISADILLAHITKQKFAIINFLLGFPAISALSYVALALFGLVSWHPYWLIIVNAVIVDFVIISVLLLRNSKKYELEENIIWQEN